MKRKNLERVVDIIDEIRAIEKNIEYLNNELLCLSFVNHGKTEYSIPLWQDGKKIFELAKEFKDKVLDELNQQRINLEKELETL